MPQMSLFSVQNAWADTTFDTRNVAVHTLVIEVTDVQDTKPYFLRAPPVTRLPETAKEVRGCARAGLKEDVLNDFV